ncbi:hypothetical protein SAMN05720470_10817 [Fibrobacter sp. UWOV1]|uniref:hypothetical protein n=1 Tax=Fibrobacter sp. UWOV1 TaxID=1896215 RepID=UPI0009222B45|nr:hypothetical protein [Fibrobacter sp. UWOV1]SHL41348.1 hypothetical protein SAMN05720470_10817 [Fibrobacter sp. UWOV1]
MNSYKGFNYQVVNEGKILCDFPNVGQLLFKDIDKFKAYVDGFLVTHDCFTMIETELRNAVEKHPKFCDDFSSAYAESVAASLNHFREVNEGKQHADAILLEEVFEAVYAYDHGEMEECLKELAQCGAVIIRMMNFVKKEMVEK